MVDVALEAWNLVGGLVLLRAILLSVDEKSCDVNCNLFSFRSP
jgi:hypothetical protein